MKSDTDQEYRASKAEAAPKWLRCLWTASFGSLVGVSTVIVTKGYHILGALGIMCCLSMLFLSAFDIPQIIKSDARFHKILLTFSSIGLLSVSGFLLYLEIW